MPTNSGFSIEGSHALSVQLESPSDEFSPLTACCDRIFHTINGIGSFPVESKMLIAGEVANILALFTASEEGQKAARKKATALERKLLDAKEQLALFRQEKFGRSSEAFMEDDADADEEDPEDVSEDPVDARKGKRPRVMPQDIETVVNHHFPDDRTCCTCGCEMNSINRWSSNRVQIIPERVICIEDVYHTCACNRGICKENAPIAAKAGRHIMAKKSVELGFAVEAACQKFMEHLPAYRLENRLKNNNVNISRQAICSYIALLGDHLEPVADAILRHIMSGAVIHMDETPVRVQAPGTGKCKTGYLWAALRDERKWDDTSKPAAGYRFAISRGGEVPELMLAKSAVRALITDGHSAYNRFGDPKRDAGPLTLVRCWAHARRKFIEANRKSPSKFAKWVLKQIKAIYMIEREADYRLPEERLAMRLSKSAPILAEIKLRLEEVEPDSQGGLKGAINYCLNAFEELTQFVQDGRIEIDNNPVERSIRPITLTRKNSLFVGREEHGRTWAVFFTLIQTCKLNRIDPRRYLNWVANHIERTGGDIDPDLLLPWKCPIGQIKI